MGLHTSEFERAREFTRGPHNAQHPGAPPAQLSQRRAYAQCARPKAAELLAAVRLDVTYTHGEGDWLTYRDHDGEPRRVLDVLGGYGSTFFGHNHPQLVAALMGALQSQRPFAAQASVRGPAGALCARLSALAEPELGEPAVVTLSNTGTEAVEAAAKHALLDHQARKQAAYARVQRRLSRMAERVQDGEVRLGPALADDFRALFAAPAPTTWPELYDALLARARGALFAPWLQLSTCGAFHGKTSGALSLTHAPHFRQPFAPQCPTTRFVDARSDQAAARLDEALESLCERYALPYADGGELRLRAQRSCRASALFLEPIQGEGGVRELSVDFVRRARALADELGFALVADEVQTGMGRTGRFFALAHYGVAADYYVLSKSLGGGLVKLGATLVRKSRYQESFGTLHTSTFAEDDHSALVGLEALDVLVQDQLVERAQRQGTCLRAELEGLCARFPHAFRGVRGRGMLLAIELVSLEHHQAPLGRALSDQGLLGYVCAGFLLHHGSVRVAPSLSSPHTLRIEPSAYFGAKEIEHFVRALTMLGQVLSSQDYGALLAYTTLDGPCEPLTAEDIGSYAVRPVCFWPTAIDPEGATLRQPGRSSTRGKARKVTFLGHFIHSDDLPLWERSLEHLDEGQRRTLLDLVAPAIEPHPILQRRIVAEHGSAVDFTFVGVPRDSRSIEAAMRARRLEPLIAELQRAVDRAEDEGAEVIGLGGYTSIVTGNGKALRTRRATLTTGNSLTSAMTLQALVEAAMRKGIDLGEATLGVVGAGGNIGRLIATLLAPFVRRVVLVGRSGRLAGLQELAHELRSTPPAASRLLQQWGAVATEADIEVCVTDRLQALSEAALIVGASNSAEAVLDGAPLRDVPRVVCDVAVPHDASDALVRRLPQCELVRGGLVRVPGAEDFSIPGVPLAPGLLYACTAETLTLGMDPTLAPARLGRLEANAVERIALAAGHAGLRLAAPKRERSY